MERPTSGDPDHVHCSQGGWHRFLDTLHSDQESSDPMGVSSSDSYPADTPSKLFLIAILWFILGIVSVNGSVIVTVSEPVIGVMEGKSVKIVCEFSDNQGAGANEVIIFWRRGQVSENLNAVTLWDKETQKGNTTLELAQVTLADMGTYVCLVKIRWSFDLQH
ncbi:hypothetical protein DV515_00018400, partial [Chloebia gouldiae]